MRSDRWYTKIFNTLFEETAKFTWKDEEKGPFTGPLWNWMNANRHSASKEAILRILLHPLIRSFRVRAALGKRDYKNLFLDLQLQPLDSTVPNVVGTYFLAGRRRSSAQVLKNDIGYAGQAFALRSKLSKGRGAKARMHEHRQSIQQEKLGKVRKKRRTEKIPKQSLENQPATSRSARL